MLSVVLLAVLLVVIVCIIGWIYGEVADNRPVRILSTLACFVVFPIVAAVVSNLRTGLDIGVPFSSAVHEYLDAASLQIQQGNTQFVVDQFEDFKVRAHVTHETEAFVDAVADETARMKAGPTQQ